MNEYLSSIIKKFLIGVLAFIPVAVILQLLLFVEQIASNIVIFVYGYFDSYLVTGLLFLFSFALFTYVGHRIAMGKSFIVGTIDNFINRIPILNTVYRVTKKIVNLISGHEKAEPREVVYIEYPKEGLWVPAYVTNKEKDKYILFVPTSPNPTSGFTVIVHESKVIKSKMDIEEATSFIISVGVDFEKADEVHKLP